MTSHLISGDAIAIHVDNCTIAKEWAATEGDDKTTRFFTRRGHIHSVQYHHGFSFYGSLSLSKLYKSALMYCRSQHMMLSFYQRLPNYDQSIDKNVSCDM
jgi:hypothetical protein